MRLVLFFATNFKYLFTFVFECGTIMRRINNKEFSEELL